MTQRDQLRSLFGSHDSGHARNFERIAFRIAGKLSEYLGTNAHKRMRARSTPRVRFVGDVHHAWAPAGIEVRQLVHSGILTSTMSGSTRPFPNARVPARSPGRRWRGPTRAHRSSLSTGSELNPNRSRSNAPAESE